METYEADYPAAVGSFCADAIVFASDRVAYFLHEFGHVLVVGLCVAGR